MRWAEGARRDGFPFDVPAVAALEGLRLDAPVTLLAGDNMRVRRAGDRAPDARVPRRARPLHPRRARRPLT
jgi:hypothetical protein